MVLLFIIIYVGYSKHVITKIDQIIFC